VQKVADDFGQGAKRTQQANHGSRSANLDQVDLHQSVPGRCDVRLYDGRHRIGNVIDGKEFVDQHGRQYVTWASMCETVRGWN
jgi:hypothetical protein